MRKLLILAAVVFLAATAATCQPAPPYPEPSTYPTTPSTRVIEQWMQAPDLRIQAWAAHAILEDHRTDLLPQLTQLIDKTVAAVNPHDQRNALQALTGMIDSVIQLNGTLPAETIAAIQQLNMPFQVATLVLLDRLPWEQARPLVFARYHPQAAYPYEPRVPAQMLAQHADAAFTAKLLPTLKVDISITVLDPGQPGWGFGSGSSSCGGGSPLEDKTWPQVGTYAFQDAPIRDQKLSANESLFLDGTDRVYLYRSIGWHYGAVPTRSLKPIDDAIRSHLVATLVSDPAVPMLPEDTISERIEVAPTAQGRELYTQRVIDLVEEQQEHYARILEALRRHNLLTEQERQKAALRITLSLLDERNQPRTDLPGIAFRPPVTWASSLPTEP